MNTQIPYIVSIAHRREIDRACKGLDKLNFRYFVMYIIFNNGDRFVLSNIYHLLVPYYTENLYQEDYSIKPSIICNTDYYTCNNSNSVSERFKKILEDRLNIHRAYYIIRRCAECTFVFGAIKKNKFDNHHDVYVNTINDFENFCVSFVDQVLDIIKDYNPFYKNSFILTNHTLRRAIIKRGYFDNEQITEREKEVLWWSSKGKSTKEIANILNISPATAQTHTRNIRNKLNCSTMTEAVVEAIHRGLIGNINIMPGKQEIVYQRHIKIITHRQPTLKNKQETSLDLLNQVDY